MMCTDRNLVVYESLIVPPDKDSRKEENEPRIAITLLITITSRLGRNGIVTSPRGLIRGYVNSSNHIHLAWGRD